MSSESLPKLMKKSTKIMRNMQANKMMKSQITPQDFYFLLRIKIQIYYNIFFWEANIPLFLDSNLYKIICKQKQAMQIFFCLKNNKSPVTVVLSSNFRSSPFTTKTVTSPAIFISSTAASCRFQFRYLKSITIKRLLKLIVDIAIISLWCDRKH